MRKILRWDTRIGPFFIAEQGGRFHAVFGDQSLGSYSRIAQAVEDLSGGHTFSVRGVNTAALGIPGDPAEWQSIGNR